MTEIGITEARKAWSALLRRVEAGEEVVITRRGRAAAKLQPVAEPLPAREAADRLRKRAEVEGGRFDWEEWKAYRDEGRR